MRQITAKYHVAPQITPDDLETIKAAGVTTIICNRPDAEIPEDLHAENMRTAVEALGLAFHVLPLTHQTMSPDNIGQQMRFVDEADGPVLAYCASGTRCSVVWALGQAMAGQGTVEDILAATSAAGYDLSGLVPTLEALRAQSHG